MDSYDFMMRNGRTKYLTNSEPVMDDEELRDTETQRGISINIAREKRIDSMSGKREKSFSMKGVK